MNENALSILKKCFKSKENNISLEIFDYFSKKENVYTLYLPGRYIKLTKEEYDVIKEWLDND